MELVWTPLAINSILVFLLHHLEKWMDIPIEWNILKLGLMMQVGIALYKLGGILVTFL